LSGIPEHSLTGLLLRWRDGDDAALDRLLPLVYGQLRRLAGRCLRAERDSHTLQTHDLIHETFLRLLAQKRVDWQNRAHFFAISACLMRRILVDHARRRRCSKRGGPARDLALDDVEDRTAFGSVDLLALEVALVELERLEPELARIVELRFFAGLEHDEVAEVLGISNPTVRRRWRMARAWLYGRLTGGPGIHPAGKAAGRHAVARAG